MEKMIWAKPELNEVAFAANEYVAACGDQNSVYKFVCNASTLFGIGSDGLYYYEDLKVEPNTSAPTDWFDHSATKVGNYSPCTKTHEASTTSDFYWGYLDRDILGISNGKHDDEETVIVWLGEDGNNGHATKNLDIGLWETAKS